MTTAVNIEDSQKLKFFDMPESNNQFVRSKVKVRKLKTGMVIKAYTKFSSRYQSMDAVTCEFVRHNFKGTRVVIIRNNKKYNTNVQSIKPGDTLSGLYDFPPALQKITIANEELRQALEKRGMLEFITVQPKAATEKANIQLKELVKMVEQSVISRPVVTAHGDWATTTPSGRIVKELVESVRKSIPIREETAFSIENEMDKARRGLLGIEAVENSVISISANDSVDALTAISSLKESQQTYDHCVDVGVIFQSVYSKIQKRRKKNSVFSHENQAMLGGFLHDFGKSVVPKELLDSKEPFEKSSRAMQIIRSHPIHGARQLTMLDMPKAIVDMARFHHVKMNTDMLTSYPKSVDYKTISFEARLISVIDIYQALVGTRTYQKSWSPAATMRYLEALAGVEIDQYAFDLFLHEMGVYPKGSIVELTDGSLGFVMNVPVGKQDLRRPIVAVVRNSEGQDLTHQHLLDLQVERDMSITRDVDRKDVFGDRTLEVFTTITI
ncbi:MAG: HD domain-containing protein [Deltaproteobacteria bacterium]|jgi:HD-GYP domain-containing protein (c-di-GMP phosphodiesterase class II)|nr:HD domain-containing protein [Deltaproteobacteria bacterium]MBT4268292.1 HD domain-containing protein [Deltaproteobacteria bacterium]MBT4643625.1 HD domain-containing protein [Deltaproteobacteria bacterium]MBT6503579.1 HD domain-containing protein [Deltaproteobacteria bacterium]MBT7711708.1 HD domain-containing protein [Deltaproteobacteria bacterium]